MTQIGCTRGVLYAAAVTATSGDSSPESAESAWRQVPPRDPLGVGVPFRYGGYMSWWKGSEHTRKVRRAGKKAVQKAATPSVKKRKSDCGCQIRVETRQMRGQTAHSKVRAHRCALIRVGAARACVPEINGRARTTNGVFRMR